jgi:serine/threonine-protein kinase
MNSDRWQQVKDLLDKALQYAPDERATFLDEACDGDDDLRHEVETFLASYQTDFMEKPAVAEVADSFVSSQDNKLASGEKISHYKIIRSIGAGGMGEVYLAKDVRLGRQVALKVLQTKATENKDARLRFVQEARAAATLNHPHIVTVYDVSLESRARRREYLLRHVFRTMADSRCSDEWRANRRTG